MTSHLHIIAACRGITPSGTGSQCVVCGESPYRPGRLSSSLLGPNFADYDCIVGGHEWACEGCVSVLGGRPSKTDPPVRMLQVVALEGEPMRVIKRADFEAILRAPPRRPFVLIWNDTMKKHASLRAGISTSDELRIGGDAGTVIYRPAEHLPLLDAVKDLRGGFARRDIVSGGYAPKKIQAFGPERWERLESAVGPHRPSYLLDFLIRTLAAPEPINTEADDMPISEADTLAADLIHLLGRGAQVNVQWGVFHSGFLLKRLRQASNSTRTLPDLIERLSRYLDCRQARMVHAVAGLRELTDEQERDVLAALKARPQIIIAIASTVTTEAPS